MEILDGCPILWPLWLKGLMPLAFLSQITQHKGMVFEYNSGTWYPCLQMEFVLFSRTNKQNKCNKMQFKYAAAVYR